MISHIDIMQAIDVVARYQSNPKQSYLLASKRIYKYLRTKWSIVNNIQRVKISN